MRLIALGELHGDAQRNQLEVALLQLHILSTPQVNPVGLTANVLQLTHFVAQIADLNCFWHIEILLDFCLVCDII